MFQTREEVADLKEKSRESWWVCAVWAEWIGASR